MHIYTKRSSCRYTHIYIYTFHTYIQYTVYSEGSFSAALIWPVKSTHDLTKSSTVSWSPRVHASRCLLDQRKTGVADGQRKYATNV